MIPTLEQVKIQLTLKGIAYMDNWLLYRDRIKSTNQNIAISSIEDAYNKLVDGYYEMNKNPLERDGIIYRAYDNFILAFTKEGVVCNVQDQRAKLFVESRLNSPFGFETTKLSLRNVRLAFDDASMSLYLNTHNPIFTVAKDEQFIS